MSRPIARSRSQTGKIAPAKISRHESTRHSNSSSSKQHSHWPSRAFAFTPLAPPQNCRRPPPLPSRALLSSPLPPRLASPPPRRTLTLASPSPQWRVTREEPPPEQQEREREGGRRRCTSRGEEGEGEGEAEAARGWTGSESATRSTSTSRRRSRRRRRPRRPRRRGGRRGGGAVVTTSASSCRPPRRPCPRDGAPKVTSRATRRDRLAFPLLFFFLLAVSRGASCLRLRNPSFAWCADAVAAMGGDRLRCGSRELVLDWYSVVFDMISDCIYSSLWGFRRLR